MSSRISLPTDPDDDDRYFRAVLLDLVDRGAALARHVQERATAPDTDPAGDPTIAFDRIARTVRRCIALARHVAAHPAAERAPEHRAAAANRARTEARTQLIRGVEDAVHRRKRDGVDADQLLNELTELLEDPALEFDLTTRPVSEIIEEICRDFGINAAGRSFVFKRRTPRDRATLRERAAAPPPLPVPAAPRGTDVLLR